MIAAQSTTDRAFEIRPLNVINTQTFEIGSQNRRSVTIQHSDTVRGRFVSGGAQHLGGGLVRQIIARQGFLKRSTHRRMVRQKHRKLSVALQLRREAVRRQRQIRCAALGQIDNALTQAKQIDSPANGRRQRQHRQQQSQT